MLIMKMINEHNLIQLNSVHILIKHEKKIKYYKVFYIIHCLNGQLPQWCPSLQHIEHILCLNDSFCCILWMGTNFGPVYWD